MGTVKRGNYKPKKENINKLEQYMSKLPNDEFIKKIIKQKDK